MNVIKNNVLPLYFNRNTFVMTSRGNQFANTIIIDASVQWVLRSCIYLDLLPLNSLSHKEFLDRSGAGNTIKNPKPTGDSDNFLTDPIIPTQIYHT